MEHLFESLKGKVVVVTGGTRGIGFETVRSFLKQGAYVALFGSRQETVDRALASLEKEDSAYPVIGMFPDLTNPEACKEAIHCIVEKWSTIDVLINNAGVSDGTSIYDYKDDQFHNIMQINVDSIFHMSKACATIMKEKGKGVIINTSSMVSIYAQRSGSAYPTSKFAVNGMTKALARELGKNGIRVNAIAPGITKTDMVAALDPKLIAGMAATIPLQRVGESQDIANAFLFLASDMASYITGAILSVDGGIVI